MQKLRVLIIGIDGNIGKALRNYLSMSGFDVFGTSRKDIPSSNVFYVDLQDLSTLNNIQGEFDAIYMCAALTNLQYCEDNSELSKIINVTAQIALADYCANLTDNLIFLSSNAVFDGNSPFATASSATNPKNTYGLHKDLVEKHLLDSFTKVTIVRTSKVVTPDLNLLLDWKNNLKQGQFIEPFYDMSLCPVTLDAILKLLSAIATKPYRGILQISGQQDILYSELALMMAKRLNAPEDLIKAKSYLDVGISPKTIYKYSSLDMIETTKAYNLHPSTMDEVLDLTSF